jgi:hypothetical protein
VVGGQIWGNGRGVIESGRGGHRRWWWVKIWENGRGSSRVVGGSSAVVGGQNKVVGGGKILEKVVGGHFEKVW